jgi:hypothetical protein
VNRGERERRGVRTCTDSLDALPSSSEISKGLREPQHIHPVTDDRIEHGSGKPAVVRRSQGSCRPTAGHRTCRGSPTRGPGRASPPWRHRHTVSASPWELPRKREPQGTARQRPGHRSPRPGGDLHPRTPRDSGGGVTAEEESGCFGVMRPGVRAAIDLDPSPRTPQRWCEEPAPTLVRESRPAGHRSRGPVWARSIPAACPTPWGRCSVQPDPAPA